MISELDLIDIVIRDSSLSEREIWLNQFHKLNTNPNDKQEEKNSLLDRWCQVVASGNWERFQKRLLWDGLDLNTSPPFPRFKGKVLPCWTKTLQLIIQTASEWSQQNVSVSFSSFLQLPSPVIPEEPLPFEELLLPVVQVARYELLTHLETKLPPCRHLPLDLLCSEAYLKLERNFLSKLVNLCVKTLYFEFSQFLPIGHRVFKLLKIHVELTPEKSYYQSFIQKLLQDGLLSFFKRYPVLGRLIATQTDFWVEATIEFLHRLKADVDEFKDFFKVENSNNNIAGTQPELGKVAQIRLNMSDPHCRGRSVIGLTFESGLKLIYKPRNLGVEVAYNQFLEWCNQQGIPLSFKVLKVLNRHTYGWVEYVEQMPIDNESMGQRFYQRTGMLLCLLYILGTNDCHQENLIANGENLVLVDMETLMCPEPDVTGKTSKPVSQIGTKAQFWEDSVLRTGLLPSWRINKVNNSVYDISGLGSVTSQPSPNPSMHWKYINTDNMYPVYQQTTIPVKKNVPILNGLPLSSNDYLEDLVKGFEQMYCFMLRKRQDLLEISSPLVNMRNQPIRFIFRDTIAYSILLEKTLEPEFLINGVSRSIELDILSRSFLATRTKPKDWEILRSEVQAMEQLDIPYFETDSSSTSLSIGDSSKIEAYFIKSAYEKLLSRLKDLDKTDLAQQIAIIRGCSYARMAQSANQASVLNHKFYLQRTSPFLSEKDSKSLISEHLFDAAHAIAEEIGSQAILTKTGEVYWTGLSYIPNSSLFQFQLLDGSLYNGNCGIALFLAALVHLKDNIQLRELALGALHRTRTVLQKIDVDLHPQLAKNIGIGGAIGIGSIIYCLVKISLFLREPSLIEDAKRFAHLITPDLIVDNQEFDVIAGAAGTILALLGLYEETFEPAILDKAALCGKHLLKKLIWEGVKDRTQIGFAHGCAGIIYALLRLYSLTFDSSYLKAACEGLTYERSALSDSNPNFSWCRGTTGIGLARLGGLSVLGTDDIYQEINKTLQVTQRQELQGVDHLCCGTLGQCELLLTTAQKLSRPELIRVAQERASDVVKRAKQYGGYRLFINLPNHIFTPGFFQGTSGIGYELLRLAYPKMLPSILLWE